MVQMVFRDFKVKLVQPVRKVRRVFKVRLAWQERMVQMVFRGFKVKLAQPVRKVCRVFKVRLA